MLDLMVLCVCLCPVSFHDPIATFPSSSRHHPITIPSSSHQIRVERTILHSKKKSKRRLTPSASGSAMPKLPGEKEDGTKARIMMLLRLSQNKEHAVAVGVQSRHIVCLDEVCD